MIKDLLNLLYPETCLGCNSLLQTGEVVLCTDCRHQLPLTNHHLTTENDAYKRLAGKVDVEQAMSMLIFEKGGIVQEIIHKLKYKGNQEIGSFLGEWYAEIIKDELKNIDCIIPVPLHKRRLRKRGYNQVDTFCEALSKGLDIPVNKEILIRKSNSRSQARQSFLGRTSVNKEIFDVNFSEIDTHKHFLLVDDVLTTGTTLEQCAKALLKIPNTKISIVVMALTI
jgi:ComF family protein